MAKVICLDTNVLWDFGGPNFSALKHHIQENVQAFKEFASWVQIQQADVVAPLFATAEYLNLQREYARYSDVINRQGVHPKRVGSPKSFAGLTEEARNDFERNLSRARVPLDWVQLKWSMRDSNRFGELLRKLIQSSHLSHTDAMVFAGALEMDASVFVSGDGDFGGEHQTELQKLMQVQGLVFINHRQFAGIKEDDKPRKDGDPIRQRPIRARMISAVFPWDANRYSGLALGVAHRIFRKGDSYVLLYFHTSQSQKLLPGHCISVVKSSYSKRIPVVLIQESNKDVACAERKPGESARQFGLQLDFRRAEIWDPGLVSAGDIVYLEPTISA